MFHRDEVDLLEEEIEDLYQRHQASTGVLSEMEADVISEQLETEERSEAEMTLTLGPQLLKEDPAHAQHAPPAPEESLSLPELLKRHTRRDPLYEEVFLWSQRVFAFAKKHYVGQTDTSRDMFRVYVNAKMIPIKFATGISEEMMDDLFSLDISEKEYELTLTYLERTIDSLQHIGFLGSAQAARLEREGRTYRDPILASLERVRDRKNRNKKSR